MSDEGRAPQKEGAQKNFTQLGVRLHNAQQVRPFDLEKLARLADAAPDEAAAAGEHIYLAGEFAGFVDCDGSLTLASRVHDFHAAGDEDVKASQRLSLIEDHFPFSRFAAPPERLEPGDLRRAELGEHRLIFRFSHSGSLRPPFADYFMLRVLAPKRGVARNRLVTGS